MLPNAKEKYGENDARLKKTSRSVHVKRACENIVRTLHDVPSEG